MSRRRPRSVLGIGTGLALLFAIGLFASVSLAGQPCSAKHGTACVTTTTTKPTTTTAPATTTTTAPSTTTVPTTTTPTTTAPPPTTTTITTTTTTPTTTTTTTATTTTPSGPTVVDQLVTPEGATIQIDSDAEPGWTAQQIYDLLKPNAYQLGLVGPDLTIKVQGQYATSESAGASLVNGSYAHYRATIYLQATPGSTFTAIPEAILAHEYGHAWSLYHYYVTENGDWTSYLLTRGLYGNPLVDSSYMWMTREMIAEDYRLLFGTATAQTEMGQMNTQVPDARSVAGLKAFLSSSW